MKKKKLLEALEAGAFLMLVSALTSGVGERRNHYWYLQGYTDAQVEFSATIGEILAEESEHRESLLKRTQWS